MVIFGFELCGFTLKLGEKTLDLIKGLLAGVGLIETGRAKELRNTAGWAERGRFKTLFVAIGLIGMVSLVGKY